ncbi:MAG: thiamine phosphate synthase [Planctomycetaceae bacterium]
MYLIVSPRSCACGVERTVADAIAGGVDLVQLRDKECDDEAFLEVAQRLRKVTADGGALFFLNDRAALLGDARADGVHVGSEDLAPELLRERFGPDLLIGLSTHDRSEVEGAAARGADYVGLGPVYASETKNLHYVPKGPRLLSDTYGATRLPVFPIGGINARNLSVLLAAGATRVAVSSAICAAPEPRAAAAALKALLPH